MGEYDYMVMYESDGVQVRKVFDTWSGVIKFMAKIRVTHVGWKEQVKIMRIRRL